MRIRIVLSFVISVVIVAGGIGLAASAASPTPLAPAADNPNPPTTPVKLIFIHHSCGENWLHDEGYDEYGGGLGTALRNNNYFVSDTNYGWGPDGIGDNTDIGYWWTWFRGPNRDTYMNALYTEYDQYPDTLPYSRLPTDPGGQNQIIMFKSCFPNSGIDGNPTDPPTTGSNPLRDQDCSSPYMTVGNVKGIYNDLLDYFDDQQDKLFVLIVSPPLLPDNTDATQAANARAVANWLVDDVNGWLASYPYNNVAVFDFYNVLTSNGGDENTNDLGQDSGNHHRWWNGAVQHIQTVNNNYLAYGSDLDPDTSLPRDNHPSSAGNLKATGEFVPLLNVFYNRWKSGAASPLTLTSPNGGEFWEVGSSHPIRWTTTGTVPQVSLAYSTDGFTTSHVINSPLANTGLYTWTTPLTPTTHARVRVASVLSPTTVFDDSDADFTLYQPGTINYLILTLQNYTSGLTGD